MRVLRGGSRFFRLIGAGAVFVGAVTAILTPLGVWSAEPALAASNTCYDVTNAQPTAAHQVPADSSPTEQFFAANTTIYGNCNYWNNPGEGHWYMRVYLTNGQNSGMGYIWVQRLAWGHQHLCFVLGTELGEARGVYQIGNSPCPLYNW